MSDHVHDGHGHGEGWWAGVSHRLGHVVRPHSHDTAGQVDTALESSRQGVRALWISLVGLGATAAAQAVVVAVSGSVALLGDTVHNLADALTAVPLAVAFLLGRRAANRRYTYGYGRAEDLAGVGIVLVIAGSAVAACYQAVDRLVHPEAVSHLWAVAAAGLVGFAGNEVVARYRIGVGRQIGSAALVADGVHARADGFTSLAVVVGAAGAGMGWRWADPVMGLMITGAILVLVWSTAGEVFRRLMDAVDPGLVDQVHTVLRATSGVLGVGAVHLRWLGHHLRAECEITVDAALSLREAHTIATAGAHALIRAVPRLAVVFVHTDPDTHQGAGHHVASP